MDGERNGPLGGGKSGGRAQALFTVAALLLSTVLALFLFRFIQGDRQSALSLWKGRLAASLDDRRAAIENYLLERRMDASLLMDFPAMREFLFRERDSADHPWPEDSLKEHVQSVLDSAIKKQGYLGIVLMEGEGAPLVQSDGSGRLPDRSNVYATWLSQSKGRPWTFFVKGKGGDTVLVVAVPFGQLGQSLPRGALFLFCDPEDWLYPFLRRERLPTLTAETLLLRRDQNKIVFLSPSRFSNAAPLALTIPYDKAGAPARFAADRMASSGEYLDHRSVPVLSAACAIRGTAWGLMVKVDRSEALAGLGQKVVFSLFLLLSVLVAFSGVAYGLLRRQRLRFLSEIVRRDERYRLLSERASDMVLFVRRDGRIIEANASAQAGYGYSQSEFASLALSDLTTDSTSGAMDKHLGGSGGDQGVTYETVHKRKDDSDFAVEVSCREAKLGKETVRLAILRDITERKRAEERIKSLNRTLTTISEINQLIVREGDRQALLNETCRILTALGGFTFAWIGFKREETGRVLPAASSGQGAPYYEQTEVRWDDTPLGRGPTGFAIRTGRRCICDDIEKYPHFVPWRDAARNMGLRSSGAFPVKVDGETIGAITVCAAEKGRFLESEIQLLEEMAGDLGYALQALKERDERRRALVSLREREERYRQLFERNLAGVYRSTADGLLLECNDAFARIFGYDSGEEMRGGRMNDLYPRPEDREAFISLLAKKKMLTSYEESLKAKDGREIFAVENVTLFEDPEGQAVIEGTLVDVTEHRMAERALMRAQDELVKAKTLQTIGMIAGGVAHEVRNPLFAINTIVTALSRKLEEQEQFKDYVSHIKDQVQRLADLMEDLLLLGRPINPSQFAPCVLSDILRQALSDLAAANPRAGEIVHLVLPGEEIAVLGVSGKLAQVFLNLIQNAVHFSLPDSVVTVSVRRDDVKVWAAVRDEGTGVPEDLLPRVFEPFQSRRKGGTGLGLAIVRKIVVEHGGIVSAQNNTPFPGATFTVRLPIMKDDCSA